MHLPKIFCRSPKLLRPKPWADAGSSTLLSPGMRRVPVRPHAGTNALEHAGRSLGFASIAGALASDPSTSDPSAPDPSAGDASAPDPSAGDASTSDPSARDAATPAGLPRLPEPDALLGGCYRIGAEIAHGAMGVVLSAFDVHLQRPVAIKLLRAERLGPSSRQRLLEEARAMALVNHPNVVRVYAFGDHQGLPFIVMEQIQGADLRHWLHTHSPADPRVALRLLHEVCAGVAAIHAVGAIHRDLKPSNILLDGELTAKIADFGTCMGSSGRHGQDVLGTPGYMPPEALAACSETASPSPRSDIYSLGCIAYELLTGRHPFRATTPGLALPPREAAIEPPSSICPHLPRALDQLVLGALQWDIERRPASVEVFLQGLLAGTAAPAPLFGTPARLPDTSAPALPCTPAPAPLHATS